MTDNRPGDGGAGDGPPPPRPSTASGCGPVIMIILGAILLLPGLCSLALMGVAVTAAPGDLFKEPEIVLLWVFCLAVSAGGLWLIIAAVRR